MSLIYALRNSYHSFGRSSNLYELTLTECSTNVSYYYVLGIVLMTLHLLPPLNLRNSRKSKQTEAEGIKYLEQAHTARK